MLLTFQRSQDDLKCKYSKLRALGFLWILRSFKKLKKVIYTLHSITLLIRGFFLRQDKNKLSILHRSRCLSSLILWQSKFASKRFICVIFVVLEIWIFCNNFRSTMIKVKYISVISKVTVLWNNILKTCELIG